MEKATLGGGCFWCLEAVYQEVDGVKSIVSGYAGGHVPNPSYEQVCTGTTGHAEVVQLEFDPAKVGYDNGPQYRSAIFWHDEAQHQVAQDVIASLTHEKAFGDPIVTEVTKLDRFWPAEL